MGDLFGTLRRQVDVSARRAVELYVSELDEYRAVRAQARDGAGMLEFAVHLRRRTAVLAEEDLGFPDEDLDYMAEVGEQRAAHGVSLAAQRRVLALHAEFTLHEVHEAASPADLPELMRMLGWLSRNGVAAQNAYSRGYLAGQQRLLPPVARVRQLTRMLVKGDPMAPELAALLGMTLPERYLVVVVRVADADRAAEETRDEVVTTLLGTEWAPMTWRRPEELVVLLPAEEADPLASPAAPVLQRAVELARAFAGLVRQPCSTGAAAGSFPSLGASVALARRISRSAPIEKTPGRAYTVADVFAELGAAETPQVDRWLRDLARRLSTGPDLVTTLDAYYRNDMNRVRTAVSMHIHPRTLDYRLRRVRELSGMDPSSTRGVRVLSTAVTRLLSGAWPEP